MSAITNAAAGIGAAFDRLDSTAAAVARPQADPADYAKAAADLVAEKLNVEANAAVMRTSTRMSTHLVDMLV